MVKKRKAFLVIELDNDELSILPPHLRGLLSRPLVGPIQTREAKASPGPWFPTEEQKRATRRAKSAEGK